MQVRELMTHDPEACLAADSCGTARAIMRRRDCAVIPIVESHATKRLLGVVTEREIARHLERVNRPADAAPVKGCMREHVKTIAPEASLEDALRLMVQSPIRCLLVVEDEHLVGILSPKDLVAAEQRLGGLSGASGQGDKGDDGAAPTRRREPHPR